MDDTIVEITTIEELLEMSSGAGGAMTFAAGTGKKKKENNMISRKDIVEEQIFRKFIRGKLQKALNERKNQENELRLIIRELLKEGDLSDTHPHRSTGINTLEDVLKKSIPTLRVDFKKLTTDKRQRDSFRAHVVKAVLDALRPEGVNAAYLEGGEEGSSALLSEPTGDEGAEEDLDLDDEEIEALQEVEIEIEDDEADNEKKKIPVEDDDEPSPEEDFGSGLEGMDETGRNHAYTSFRKISQYVLDAFDSLANPKDKKVFTDYLVTNLKLYFDKFEDELKNTVEEPTTPEYDKAKGGGE
jgi:hypothetical protein